ncbi:MAG: pilus assembly FimT family protein [Myxococcaceae bacterium]
MKARGFTLLEMMVVVAIGGVMASMAVIGFRQSKAQANVSGVARAVTGSLQRGRTLAVVGSNPHHLLVTGPQVADITNTRVPDIRGHLTLLRDAQCAVFQTTACPGTLSNDDIPVFDEELPRGSNASDGGVQQSVAFRIFTAATWTNVSSSGENSIRVLFNRLGRPTVTSGSTSGTITAHALPLLIEVRDPTNAREVATNNPLNNDTRRCVRIAGDGTATVSPDCI